MHAHGETGTNKDSSITVTELYDFRAEWMGAADSGDIKQMHRGEVVRPRICALESWRQPQWRALLGALHFPSAVRNGPSPY